MATDRPGDDHSKIDDELEESIEVAGVPLVVWAARLSLFLLIQGLVVLGSYAYYGFDTNPAHFGLRLDTTDNLSNWAVALAAWAISIYALWQAGLRAEEKG